MTEAYRKLFGFMDQRKRAYQLTFQPMQPANVAVLHDLARFCRAHESTFHPDPRVAANLDGRREVYLRIVNHLGLTVEQLLDLSTGGSPGVANGEN